MSEFKESAAPSTFSSTPASTPSLSKDQLKGFLIAFMDQLAATPPPAVPIESTNEADRPKPDESSEAVLPCSEATAENPRGQSSTSGSPHLKEEIINGVRFVNESNPRPSSELIGGIPSSVSGVPGRRKRPI